MKACRSSSSLTWIRPCGPSTQRSRATRGPTSSRDTGWKECNARRRWLNPSRKLQKSSFGRSGVQARIAVASANSQEKVCAALLQHMGFLQDPGEAGGIERALLAIAPGSKTGHFQRIAKASGVDFSEMLFFDDRAMNVRAAEKLGIVAQQVSSLDGLTWAQFHAGLRAWRSQRRSSRVLAQWMKAPKGPAQRSVVVQFTFLAKTCRASVLRVFLVPCSKGKNQDDLKGPKVNDTHLGPDLGIHRQCLSCRYHNGVMFNLEVCANLAGEKSHWPPSIFGRHWIFTKSEFIANE
ncbi:unnamed protein product [Durusdinium trenchii]